MKKSIYRKLKDYIQQTEYGTTSIFGTLHDSRNVYCYQDKNGKWREYNCGGTWASGEMEHLLDYYVVGIYPFFQIVKDRIVVQLRITLEEEPRLL